MSYRLTKKLKQRVDAVLNSPLASAPRQYSTAMRLASNIQAMRLASNIQARNAVKQIPIKQIPITFEEKEVPKHYDTRGVCSVPGINHF